MALETPHWYWIDSSRCDYDFNMALDEALMDAAPQTGRPVLRFYGWNQPAASFGYSQRYADLERMTRLRPLVRRCTGGGLVPHDADWTYSLAFPAGHFWYELKAEESYLRVHEWVRDALKQIGIAVALAPAAQKDAPGQCFIGAEKSDVLWRGRKIAGAAQRRTHNGLLIQGSVQPPPGAGLREPWQQALLHAATEQWGVQWEPLTPDPALQARAETLRREKYSQDSHNRKR